MNRTAVIFDFDGTITLPAIDFDAIRAEIGIENGPILEAMTRMDGRARARAEAILGRHEQTAAENAQLQDGAAKTLRTLRERGHPVAILTRNARRWVELVLGRYGIATDAMRTREDKAIKPSPEPVLSLCRELDAEPAESWMVGDYLFDILSGSQAGAGTILMLGDGDRPAYADQADFVIRKLPEVLGIIDASPGSP